jgi:hypothetical protein
MTAPPAIIFRLVALFFQQRLASAIVVGHVIKISVLLAAAGASLLALSWIGPAFLGF